MTYKLGIDIGGTKVNFGLLDGSFNLVFSKKIPVAKSKLPTEVLSDIYNELCAVLNELNIKKHEIISVGIGVPGTVSSDAKTVIKAPNLNWNDVNVFEIFKEISSFDATVIQDSRASAYGEYILGNGKGAKTLLCITLGTGIGTGLIIEGKIYDGALGSAGELGHQPAVKNGRECGCGKFGCVECYSAGKGLDATAKELYGAEHTAKTLFEKAQNGDGIAITKINEAVEMLSKTIVGAINLLSPDCLIFSGGLSMQKELYLIPLIDYIKNNSYSIEKNHLEIKYAKWGEDAPMIGAALAGKEMVVREKPMLSASIMCGELLNLGKSIKELEKANIDYIHFDVMDGHFVPNIMLPLMLVKDIKKATEIPLEIHLMVENPQDYINELKLHENDIITVHYESTPHIQSALSMIKNKGVKVGLAINPGTSLYAIEDLLDDIDMLLIMTVNPGFAGQKIVPQSFKKIQKIRKYLDDNGYKDVIIEVDGNCSFENVPKLYNSGAQIFVVGSSSVFSPEYTIETATNKLLKSCEEKAYGKLF